jgi:ATP-binding cassette subfamily B protein
MILEPPVQGQRFFAPEVVQTSAMDCGPAALKSILEGFGVPVSYGRLREACQTDVDGTSINTLEDIAVQLGLRAEQVMLPADHLLLPEAGALPAIVVTRLPNGFTHFLVVWSRVGPFLQVMDPSTGRRWPTWERFQNELYIHDFPVPAVAWREWAGSEGMLGPLRRRLLDLGIGEQAIAGLVAEAGRDPGWRPLATLDAATRMMASIVRAGGLGAGDEVARVLERFYRLNLEEDPFQDGSGLEAQGGVQAAGRGLKIPASYWSVTPLPREQEGAGEEPQPERLLLHGAVLVRVLGVSEFAGVPLEAIELQEGAAHPPPLPPDLEAALKEPSYRPEREVWDALRQDGLLTPAALALAMVLATIGVLVEALLFQGLITIGQSLSLVGQRILLMLMVLFFVLAIFFLELPIASTVLRMGRRLETRLRIAYLEKLPRLGDRYFRSRLASDMTQRAHDLRDLRALPGLGFNLLRTGFQLLLTALAVIWLDPVSAPFAILGTAFFVAFSLLTSPVLEERDLRLRTHIGALSRFYLDALLGLMPARTHGAERAMRRQHEVQLFEWVQTGRDYQRLASYIQSVGTLLYSVFAILIVVSYVSKGVQAGEVLLLFYWTLSLPALGGSLADQIQNYPMLRNRMLRILEPLGAPDEERVLGREDGQRGLPVDRQDGSQPVGISMENVHVLAGGHEILKQIDLSLKPGEHIAIVGLSGAGKSSLLGLLLGWHRPARGAVRVDGEQLDGRRLSDLRRQTAWVDPAVQLWNRSLYDNLRYGVEQTGGAPIGATLQQADLLDVLERLPEGMKTELGEGGGLVSGGEGQRVRLGRAMHRPRIRLVLLDEPFRGLDREKRRKLLAEARRHWGTATLLCVTHDVGETLGFPRVLVIEEGRIIEDGEPGELAGNPGSRYRQLLDAEEAVRRGLWESAEWRRLVIDDGRLSETQEE